MSIIRSKGFRKLVKYGIPNRLRAELWEVMYFFFVLILIPIINKEINIKLKLKLTFSGQEEYLSEVFIQITLKLY